MNALATFAVRTLHRAIVNHAHAPGDYVVFFEAEAARASATVRQLLCQVWGVEAEDLDVYNVATELELRVDWAMGDPATGDARLFEVGCGAQGVIYAQPARTLMFTSLQTLLRLQLAQASLPAPGVEVPWRALDGAAA